MKLKYPFDKKYAITQYFGSRPEYYKQFSLAGHEGLDYGAPLGTAVRSAFDGEVILDTDDPKSGAYGNFVVIWSIEYMVQVWYCHLNANLVNHGQKVRCGDIVGYTGNSGNTSGFHLHLNIAYTDERGNRINRNNGYKGFVNPLEGFEWVDECPTEDMGMTIDEKKQFEDLVNDVRNAEQLKGTLGKNISILLTQALDERISPLAEEIGKINEKIENGIKIDYNVVSREVFASEDIQSIVSEIKHVRSELQSISEVLQNHTHKNTGKVEKSVIERILEFIRGWKK